VKSFLTWGRNISRNYREPQTRWGLEITKISKIKDKNKILKAARESN